MIVRMGEVVSGGRVGASMSESELTALRADQSRICAMALEASRRGSPAAPGLNLQCSNVRAANFARGVFVTQSSPVDAHYRVQLTNAGEALVSASPALQAARAKLAGASRQRGFTMGVAVSRGSADGGYLSFLRAGLDGELQAGLAAALSNVQGPSGSSGEESGGVPRAVVIGGAVVVVGGLAALAWKFLL